jgi:membrane-bound lytic murein transglycosylase B
MQFMPATWKAYGVDANGDGKKDPYNPVDAIFAAARYLKAAGGERTCARRSSPTTTPTGTSTRSSCAPA